MECTLTQPKDKNQKWGEGAAAQAYGKKELQKLIAADQAEYMTCQKFYYCGLNLLKPSTKREYVDVCFSEPERLLQTT